MCGFTGPVRNCRRWTASGLRMCDWGRSATSSAQNRTRWLPRWNRSRPRSRPIRRSSPARLRKSGEMHVHFGLNSTRERFLGAGSSPNAPLSSGVGEIVVRSQNNSLRSSFSQLTDRTRRPNRHQGPAAHQTRENRLSSEITKAAVRLHIGDYGPASAERTGACVGWAFRFASGIHMLFTEDPRAHRQQTSRMPQ